MDNVVKNMSDVMDLIFYIIVGVLVLICVVFLVTSQANVEKKITQTMNEIVVTSLFQRKAAERVINNERLKTLSYDSGNGLFSRREEQEEESDSESEDEQQQQRPQLAPKKVDFVPKRQQQQQPIHRKLEIYPNMAQQQHEYKMTRTVEVEPIRPSVITSVRQNEPRTAPMMMVGGDNEAPRNRGSEDGFGFESNSGKWAELFGK